MELIPSFIAKNGSDRVGLEPYRQSGSSLSAHVGQDLDKDKRALPSQMPEGYLTVIVDWAVD